MFSVESESYIIAAAEYQNFGGHRTLPRDWHPNVDRFFKRYAQKMPVWDACGYLYHLNVLPTALYTMKDGTVLPYSCDACRIGYAGHETGLERGRILLGGVKL